jgi:sRNA-binding regulator protein Hfq
MSVPKPGDSAKVVLRNGEVVEGTVEWVDGNGAWVKNAQKSRWVPIEAFLQPAPPEETKKDTSEE